MIDYQYYGTLDEANEYFDHKLAATAWGTDADKQARALWAATQIIDTLNFKGAVAGPAQPREFPRGADTDVPQDIRTACYDMAYDLLDGKDPEIELENLGITSQAYSSVELPQSMYQAE
jgi:hypothetical protein